MTYGLMMGSHPEAFNVNMVYLRLHWWNRGNHIWEKNACIIDDVIYCYGLYDAKHSIFGDGNPSSGETAVE